MARRHDPATPTAITDLIERYLNAKSKGRGTGNYRSLAASALGQWHDWLVDVDVVHLEEISDDEMRAYAQELRRLTHDGKITASTAGTYYSTIRACLNWAVEDGLISENPAVVSRATNELPDDSREPNRQFWQPDDVRSLLSYVNRRVDEALDDGELTDAAMPLRDRALVSLLATTGVRGAEIFRDGDDDREGRQGLRWRRLNLDGGSLTVLGKSQDWEHAQLPVQAREHLRRHRDVQRPATDEWPVFATAHVPSKYRAVRRALNGRGWDDTEIEDVLEERSVDDLLREHEITSPAITVRGARSVMQRLCEEAGIECNGEYLKIHGARRGLGNMLYRESAELAQAALRHSSIRTTHDAYAHIEASETADLVGSVLDNTWNEDNE